MKKIFYIGIMGLLMSCQPTDKTDQTWIPLFNGKDINDWVVKVHHHDAGVNFGNTFRGEN